ncbi:MAG TPA: hopanoid-associated sugar epimerase [Vicinamibacterales bacterium]
MISAVTGATGFVGSHVARMLVARGDSVRVLVRPESDRRALRDLPVTPVVGDLRDRASLDALVRGARHVFHVAADYRLWARHPQELFAANVDGTAHLLDACRPAAVERLVYTSTVSTIAVPREGALPTEATEARIDEMIGAYKRSKFLAEQLARDAARAGLPVVIVNPTTPVGPGDWKPTPTGRMVLDFIRGKMPAYIETGLNVIAVEDVARGHLLAAERGAAGERYLLGGRNIGLQDLWRILARITGRRAPSIRIPWAAAAAIAVGSEAIARVRGAEPRVPLDAVRIARHAMYVDTTKAARDLGFTAGSVEAALARAVAWFVAQGYTGAPVAAAHPAAAGGAGA